MWPKSKCWKDAFSCVDLRYSFFFKLFIYFTLQHCIGFAIHWLESTMGVHVFPILNPHPTPTPYHPSESSQCTSPKHPVSCIEPGLAIHFPYDTLHVSMPFSHIIPLSPSPTESKRVLFQTHSGCQQNLVPCSHRDEVSVLFLGFRCGLLSVLAPKPWVKNLSPFEYLLYFKSLQELNSFKGELIWLARFT